MKADEIEFSLSDSVQAIGRQLQQIAQQLKASVDRVQSTSGALDEFDDHADIEVVLSGKVGLLSAQEWAVQVYVTDYGDERGVRLIALGTGGLDKAMWGARGALKMSASRSRRDAIASALGAP